MESPKGSAKVTIFGNDYHIQAEEDPEYIEMIARYVDDKMRELQGKSTVSSTTKIAILVAMNIADDLHRAKGEHGTEQHLVDQRAEELAVLLEDAVDD